MNRTLKARLIAAGIAAAIPLVMFFEGLRTQTYIDLVGIPTACFGYTDKRLQLGQQFTLNQCDNLLAVKLLEANRAIDTCVTVPISRHQRAAFASFIYNIGGGAFCRSTLVRKLNRGDHAGACNELLRWIYAGNRKLPGLVNRRHEERALCLKGMP